MSKTIVRRLETLNTRLWRESIVFEKMNGMVSDLEVLCGDLSLKDDSRFPERVAAQSKACQALRNLSWELAQLESKTTDLAYAIDSIIDDIEEI